MKKSISSACILFVCLVFSIGNASANLIVNGDFEQGNSGFHSDYTYGGTGDKALWPAGTYSVVAQAQDVNLHFSATGDHTSGDGLYLNTAS